MNKVQERYLILWKVIESEQSFYTGIKWGYIVTEAKSRINQFNLHKQRCFLKSGIK